MHLNLHLHKHQYEGWLTARAVVETVVWMEPEHEQFGYYDVIYSYEVEGVTYQGRFHDYGEETEEYMGCTDCIEVLYNPKEPNCCHYPMLRTLANRKMMYIGMGVISGPTCC